MLRRIVSFIGRHRRAAGIAGVAGVGLVAFVLVWFQPQKLFLEQRVNEAPPGRGDDFTAAPADQSRSPQPSQPTVLASGTFQSLEHETRGKALVLEVANGDRILRFENLNTSNGPDLHVYLSEIPPSDDWHAYGVRFVSLGKLKGNIGNQNYTLPDGLDLSRFKSAVVWCKRFSVGFGVAGLPQLGSMPS